MSNVHLPIPPPINPEANLSNEIHLFSAQAIATLPNSQSAGKTRHTYLNAMENGNSMVVYAEPVDGG